MDEDWADEILARRAREGELLGDRDLGILRLERRQRELIELFIAGGVLSDAAMFSLDREGLESLALEGYDTPEIDEAKRRLAWLTVQSLEELPP